MGGAPVKVYAITPACEGSPHITNPHRRSEICDGDQVLTVFRRNADDANLFPALPCATVRSHAIRSLEMCRRLMSIIRQAAQIRMTGTPGVDQCPMNSIKCSKRLNAFRRSSTRTGSHGAVL